MFRRSTNAGGSPKTVMAFTEGASISTRILQNALIVHETSLSRGSGHLKYWWEELWWGTQRITQHTHLLSFHSSLKSVKEGTDTCVNQLKDSIVLVHF